MPVACSISYSICCSTGFAMDKRQPQTNIRSVIWNVLQLLYKMEMTTSQIHEEDIIT